MFRKLFSKEKLPVQPLDRGAIFEDPLDQKLKERGLGEVTGGGTLMGQEGEIRHCDIEISVGNLSDDALAFIRDCLETLGAPKGSELRVAKDGSKIAFGVNEGLAVYLNGTDLPDDVYRECDVNLVISEFERLLGSNGRMLGHWEGPRETALYLYGRSYEVMVGCLGDFLGSYPLCQKARLKKIA